MTFGIMLAALRRGRGWSQEALAHRSGLSQRHVSFLETGRSKPGQKSLTKLISALALKSWEQRALLQTLAPQTISEPAPLSDDTLARELVERISPWPTYAFRPEGTLVAANVPMRRLMESVEPGEDLWRLTAPPSGPNIYDIIFHPRGLIRWMTNPEDVIPETMRRFRIDAAHNASLVPTLERLERYPSVSAFASANSNPPAVLVERYRLHGKPLAIISVLSHLASPGEPELDALRFESFVPDDEQSERLLKAFQEP